VLCRNFWANKDERINEWIAQDLDENGRLAIVSAIGPLFLVNDRLWQRDNPAIEPYCVPLTVDPWPDLTWPDVILLQGSIMTSEDQPQDQWCGRMSMRMLRDLINRQRRADGYSWVNNITTTDCYCLRIHVRARCPSTTDNRRSNSNIHSVCRWLVLRCRSSCAQKPPSIVRSLQSSAINYSYYTVAQKRPKFETVSLEIISSDFDDVWQKYSKDSRIEFDVSVEFSRRLNFELYRVSKLLGRFLDTLYYLPFGIVRLFCSSKSGQQQL